MHEIRPHNIRVPVPMAGVRCRKRGDDSADFVHLTGTKNMRRHDHEWGDSGFCVHCQMQNPADAADERAGNWLARGNELKEKGKLEAAEKCYEKSANLLMRANDLRGL